MFRNSVTIGLRGVCAERAAVGEVSFVITAQGMTQFNHQLTRINTNEDVLLASSVSAHCTVTPTDSPPNPSPRHAIRVNSCSLVVPTASLRLRHIPALIGILGVA